MWTCATARAAGGPTFGALQPRLPALRPLEAATAAWSLAALRAARGVDAVAQSLEAQSQSTRPLPPDAAAMAAWAFAAARTCNEPALRACGSAVEHLRLKEVALPPALPYSLSAVPI